MEEKKTVSQGDDSIRMIFLLWIFGIVFFAIIAQYMVNMDEKKKKKNEERRFLMLRKR